MEEKMSFEEALKSLEEIVQKMESGTESLESSLKLFEEGTRLSAYCSRTLQNAEQKITQLSLSEDDHAEL